MFRTYYPNNKSSTRTKNRLREHNNRFELLADGLFEAKPAVLVTCVCKEHMDNPWLGWLILEELRWQN